MGREIERKFLVQPDGWRRLKKATGLRVRQGYLCVDQERTVRVRRAGNDGFLTIKGEPKGLARAEFEYPIPPDEADYLLDHLCLRPLIEKTRYRIRHRGRLFEVDEFSGENRGLVMAELELQDESEKPDLPDWLGEEVSHDPRYLNSNLVTHPFTTWKS